MKKMLILLVVCFVSVILFDVFFRTKSKMDFENYVLDNSGIELKECPIVRNDSDRAFNGDGFTVAEFDCSKVEVSINKDKMKELPYTENLNIVMNVHEDEEKYNYNFSKEYKIPSLEKGYYYFVDDYAVKYKDLDDVNSDEKLISEDRSAMNFTLLLYDEETKHFYYFEYDT